MIKYLVVYGYEIQDCCVEVYDKETTALAARTIAIRSGKYAKVVKVKLEEKDIWKIKINN